MRSHILWILLAQLLIFGILIWAYSAPSEQKLNNLAKRAEAEAKSERDFLSIPARFAPPTFKGVLAALPADYPQKVAFFEAQREEQKHLKKLIEHRPTNHEYKFRLAMSYIREEDKDKGDKLLQEIAPENETGFPAAQLFRGEELLNQPVKSSAELKQNQDKALIHFRHFVAGEPSNTEAQEYIAQLLLKKGQSREAHKIYTKLFTDEPKHYSAICRINESLDAAFKNQVVLISASKRLRKRLVNSDDISIWVNSWQQYIDCLTQLKNFETAERDLKLELVKNVTTVSDKKLFKKLLADRYHDWAKSLADVNQNGPRHVLEFLEKTIALDPNHPEALAWLTLYGCSGEKSIREKAISIYDPSKANDPPREVLYELGCHAIRESNYDSAIQYLEKAKKKAPRNQRVLLKLATAYLKSEPPNPERALLFADLSLTLYNSNIQQLPDEIECKQYAELFKIRGMSLERLDRLDDAFNSLEYAAETLVEDTELNVILEQLRSVRVYQSRMSNLWER